MPEGRGVPTETNERGLGAVWRLHQRSNQERSDTGEMARPATEQVPARVPRWAWSGASAVCLLGAVIPLAYLSWSRADTPAESSVELFFANPAHVASWTDRRSVTFDFVVHNLTDQRQRHRLAVTVSSHGQPRQTDSSDVVDLDPRESRLVKWTVASPPQGRFEVNVTLAGTGTRIHFWTQSPSSGSGRALVPVK